MSMSRATEKSEHNKGGMRRAFPRSELRIRMPCTLRVEYEWRGKKVRSKEKMGSDPPLSPPIDHPRAFLVNRIL